MSAKSKYAALASVIAHEAGYINDPQDPGGPTKYGITLRDHSQDIGDLNGDGLIDAADVRLITVDQAVEIYDHQYWDAIHGDELPDAVAFALLDVAVMSGPRTAIKLLQRGLGLDEDGIIGPKTITASQDSTALAKLTGARKGYYARLPGFARYGRGWYARADAVDQEARVYA